MYNNNIQAHKLTMTKKLIDNVKEVCSLYFTSLKKKSQSKLQSDKNKLKALKALNNDINEINQKASVLKRTITELRADADKTVLSAEKEQNSKMLSLLLQRLML